MSDKAMDVALWRYSLIREAAQASLSKAERGAMVRHLAEVTHAGPFGEPHEVSRQTIDRWIRAWRVGGFEALRPAPRQVLARTPAELLELAETLRKEPQRTAAHIAELIATARGYSPSARTLQRHLRARGLGRGGLTADASIYGRFEASVANELWVGDALHGPVVEGKKAILFCYLDDHSRLATGYRFVHSEDSLRAQHALRRGITSRGVPQTVYLDNGSPFVDRQLLRALAVLGVRLVHSKPGRPLLSGRKQERLNSYIRQAFLAEVEHRGISSFAELNDFFSAWVEQVANTRVHAETKERPIARFLSTGQPTLPDPDLVREAFRWSLTRRVTKTATVSLLANRYEVDPILVGKMVELRFDPEDLSRIDVVLDGVLVGKAIPYRIGRHVHPAVPQAVPPPPEPESEPSIDYLHLVRLADDEAKGVGQIPYAEVPLPGFGPDEPDSEAR